MTATNHALTGVAIAIAVKRPELAIPLAFLSHFLLDMIPHYNPAGATRQTFKSSSQSWATKFADRNFKLIFIVDMVLFVWILLFSPFIAPLGVSSWTVFFSALAAAAPDFWGGRVLIYKKLGWKVPSKADIYTRLHIAAQFVEKPWGIWVELAWFVLMISVIGLQMRA
jgi:hypothetical protein